MECKKCGYCCKMVILPSYSILKWRKGYKRSFNWKGREWLLFEMPCKYLTKDNLCGIQGNKPKPCKDFPYEVTPEGHPHPEQWYKAYPDCGYNKGGQIWN